MNQTLSSQYQIVRKIGDGGMGVVYLGRDLKLGRFVAIKRLSRSAMEQPTLRQRFLREAKAVAALNHIHIVHVYALGEDESGPYIVMEYVPGPTGDSRVKPPHPQNLADRVTKGGPLSAEDAVELLLKLCRAVEYAHSCGVIHRDLKPGNVLLDETGEPKVVDFGLARHTRTGGVPTGPLTVPGEKMLSLGYGAPEQEVDASLTDERSDVYGLGAILYFSITGQNPRYFRETDVPEALRMPILKALKTDKEKRWKTVRAFADALVSIRAPTTVEVPTAKTSWRCKWCDTVNPVTIQYCGECGWDGREFCAECGAETRVGIQFCGECGANAREYEAAVRLLSRLRQYWENRELERIDQQAGSISSFTPIGPSGRKMVKQVHDLLRRSRQAIERREQLVRLIPQELAAQNYERARQYIEEYDGICLDHRFSGQLATLPDLTISRDIKRARRAASRREWDYATSICRELLDKVSQGHPEVKRLLRAIRLQRLRIGLRTAGATLLLVFFAYVYSAAPVYRFASERYPRFHRSAYGFARFLQSDSWLRRPLELYAGLWGASEMFAVHPQPPAPPQPPRPAAAPEVLNTLKVEQKHYEKVMAGIESAFVEKVKAWPEAYMDALARLRQSIQRRGDFEGWLAVEDELVRFQSEQTLATEMLPETGPAELRKTQQHYEAMLERYHLEKCRQIVDGTNGYVGKLVGLRKKLTMAGRTEAAKEVHAEIQRARSDPRFMEAEAAVKATEEAAAAAAAASG